MSWENQATKVEEKVEKKMEFKSLKDSKENRGIKILSYGNFSTGKTHFALSSDKPVFIIDTENGASPLADKFPDAKVLNICNLEGDDVDEKDEVKNFENFQEAVNQLIKMPDNEIGTVVVDSVSDIWEWAQAYGKVKIFKLTVEDRLKQQWDWGIINKLYLTQIKKLINKNCNVIFTARDSETYNGPGQPSGRFEPKCQKKTPFWVDIVLYHEIKFINKQVLFQATVQKCRHNEKIIGKTMQSPNMQTIKQLIEQK